MNPGTTDGERMLRAVSRATSVATASLDPVDIMDATAEALVRFFAAKRADLWRFHDGRLTWRTGAGAEGPSGAPDEAPLLVDRIARGGLAQVLRVDQMLDGTWAQWRRMMFALDCRQLGVYALVAGDQPLGCVTLALGEESSPPLDAVSLFVEQVASALDKARLHDSERAAAAAIELQNELLTRLADCRELGELQWILAAQVQQVHPNARVSVSALDRTGRAIIIEADGALDGRARLASSEEHMLLMRAGEESGSHVIGSAPPMQPRSFGLGAEEQPPYVVLGHSLTIGDRTVGCLLGSVPVGDNASRRGMHDFLRAAAPAVTIGLENALMFRHEKTRSRRLAAAQELGRRISTVISEDEVFERLVPGVSNMFSCARVAAYSVTGSTPAVLVVAGDDSPGPRRERELVASAVERLRRRRLDHDEITCHAVPLVARGNVYGVLYAEVPEDADILLDDGDMALLESVADQAAGTLSVIAAADQVERNYKETIQALVSALEVSDEYTAGHANDVADWAVEVGRRLGLTDEELRDLELGAIFHDIGKIAIPNEILNKPGRLTDEEFEIMKSHTVAGERIIAPIEFLQKVRPMVRHEHERWDGKGYPDGISGTEIPLGSRIIFVCDAYHAITSDRPYRQAQPHEFARKILVENAGTQFDPAVVSVFLDVVDQMRTAHGLDKLPATPLPNPAELPPANADHGSASPEPAPRRKHEAA